MKIKKTSKNKVQTTKRGFLILLPLIFVFSIFILCFFSKMKNDHSFKNKIFTLLNIKDVKPPEFLLQPSDIQGISGTDVSIDYSAIDNLVIVQNEISYDGGLSWEIINPINTGDMYSYKFNLYKVGEYNCIIKILDSQNNLTLSNNFTLTVTPPPASYTPKKAMYGDPRIIPNVPSNVVLEDSLEMFINQHEDGVRPNGLDENIPWGYGTIIRKSIRPNWSRVGLWGQVYLEKGYTYIPENVAIELSNFMMYLYNPSTGNWDTIHNVVFDNTNTLFYDDNFENDANLDFPNHKKIVNNGSSIIIRWDEENKDYNFHPYSQSKFDFVTNGYAQSNGMPYVVSSFDARLVKWDENGPDNLDYANFIFNVGGDYWDAYSEVWTPDWNSNGEIGGGQFRKVTREWKTAWFTNVPKALCDTIMSPYFISN